MPGMESFAPLLAAAGLVTILLGLSLVIPFDRSYRIERILYRHHRLTGLLLTLSACLLVWLSAPVDILKRALLALLAYLGQLSANAQLWPLINTGLACIVLAVGLTIAFRPSALKPLEAYLNRDTAIAWGKDRFDVTRWSRQLGWTQRLLLSAVSATLGGLLVVFSVRSLLH